LEQNFLKVEQSLKEEAGNEQKKIKGKSFLPETKNFDLRERAWESTEQVDFINKNNS
jgi:hypothetical protein